MYEFEDSIKLQIQENEVKPNIYTARTLQVAMIALVLSLLLDEVGIFYVDKQLMRLCCGAALICAFIPQILAANKRTVSKWWCKYAILTCVCVMVFVLELSLFIFVAPVCVLPMLLAPQYNSYKFSNFAIVGSGIAASVTLPLGCIAGLWDSSFMELLLSWSVGANAKVAFLDSISTSSSVIGISLYISFPWLLCVIMFSRLTMAMTKKGAENVRNQIKILEMSRLDFLTGLYNQNVYKGILEREHSEGCIGVIFFDVDGLKEANDTKGHESGDLLLKHCAESVKQILDCNSWGFRIGGDEFVVLVDTNDPNVIENMLCDWEEAIGEINNREQKNGNDQFCHMSVGTAFGSKAELSSLIKEADMKMYENKELYHNNMAADRNKRA